MQNKSKRFIIEVCVFLQDINQHGMDYTLATSLAGFLIIISYININYLRDIATRRMHCLRRIHQHGKPRRHIKNDTPAVTTHPTRRISRWRRPRPSSSLHFTHGEFLFFFDICLPPGPSIFCVAEGVFLCLVNIVTVTLVPPLRCDVTDVVCHDQRDNYGNRRGTRAVRRFQVNLKLLVYRKVHLRHLHIQTVTGLGGGTKNPCQARELHVTDKSAGLIG